MYGSGQGPILSILGLFKAWLNYLCDGQSKMSIKFVAFGTLGVLTTINMSNNIIQILRR
jgi:hypothetical protein